MDRSTSSMGIKIPQTIEQINVSSSSTLRMSSRYSGNDRRINVKHCNNHGGGYNHGRGKNNRESATRISKKDNGNDRFLISLDSRKPRIGNGGGGTFNKERFVQANYQFVVSGMEDYGKHLRDPDLPISWDLITEVMFTAKSDDHGFGCPICLHYPVAAKMTRCGHIYCWSCMLHYLSLSDKRSRPCPICFQNVTGGELKSVTIVQKENHVPGLPIRFRLMKIRRGSTLPVPVEQQEQFEHSFNIKNFDPISDMFHKIFVSSKQQRLELIERECQEINAELVEFQRENMPEICFLETALKELEQAKKSLLTESNSALDEGIIGLLNVKSIGENQSEQQQDPYTYFYQSDDGQHIYLHSINVRMLKHQYQELKYCPPIIEGQMVELHRQTVTSDLRKRFAHLRHLPVSCEFSIAEVEFDRMVVGPETVKLFQSEIQKRRKERKRREAVQTARDRNIEIENNRKILNIHPVVDFGITAEDFPVYQLGELETAGSLEQEAPPPLPPIVATETPGTSPSTSFANMLQGGNLSFDRTVRNKKAPVKNSDQDGNVDDALDPDLPAPSSLVLSDFFEQCVKISSNKKKAKKNRK